LRTEDWARLEDAARTFGASYEVKQKADGAIEVAHTSFLYVIDSTGNIQVQWPFGFTSEDMENDMRRLLARQA
jgi:protein SCO1/2